MTNKTNTGTSAENVNEFQARVEALKIALKFSMAYGDLTQEKWANMDIEDTKEEFSDLFRLSELLKDYLLNGIIDDEMNEG